MIFLSVLLQEQLTVFLLLERDLISWSLATDERSGYKDLCGSSRRSVIPCIHGESCCITVCVLQAHVELA
jgi:hypothetical protein